VTAQARRSHSGVGHPRSAARGEVSRAAVPARPEVSARRWVGTAGRRRYRGRAACPAGPVVVRSEAEECSGPHRGLSGAEECPGPSPLLLEHLTSRSNCRAPEEDPTRSVARLLLRTEDVVRDPEAGEAPPHCLLVPRCQRCLRDVLRDHVLAEPDPHPAPVLLRRHFCHSHCLLTP
jgi:hypothetical protein